MPSAPAPLLSNAQVVAALITGGCAVVAAVIAGLVAWRNARRTEEMAKQKEATHQAVRDVATRAAYEVAEFEAVTTFDESGSGEHVRKWIGIKASQSVTNLKIPCKFNFSPGAKSKRPVVEELPNSLLPAHFEVTLEANTRIEGHVVLDGLITPDTGYVGFCVRQTFEAGFVMTKEEALDRYKGSDWRTEYAASSVTVTSGVLRRAVSFPESHRHLAPPPQAVVFIGEGEVVDNAETARVKPSLTVLDNSATLVVQAPQSGFRYAIAWMPPPRK
jgi:hypothetical protein